MLAVARRQGIRSGRSQPRLVRRLYSTQPKHVRVIRSNLTDPLFNLAMEEWIFNEMDTKKPILYLWRNSPAVIIGRHQNPWKECNLRAMEADGVVLARRKSGGGAVFQDLGNSIWTFLSSKEDYSPDRNYSILKNAIAQFGISAEFSGRNDILVDGRKVSGSAYKLTAEKAMHHGTILVNLNKDAAAKYLTVNKEKLKSKGVDSVRQRIMNLTEVSPSITHDTICDALITEFFKAYDTSCEIETLDMDILQKEPILQKYYEEFKDWEWRFGKTPEFEYNLERRFDWGIMDVYIKSHSGRISAVKIYSDTLFPIMVDELQNSLLGAPYDPQGIAKAIDKAKVALAGTGCEMHVEDFKNWFIQSL